MQSHQKVEKKPLNQPNIIMFASPSITPSNNYKTYLSQANPCSGMNATKDLNNPQIQGRKVDSPQLRIMKDPTETKSMLNGSHQGIAQFKREEFQQMLNFHNPVSELSHTNKDIQKKQFDFNIKQPKANITIQYDSYDHSHKNQSSNHHSQSRHQKGSKSQGTVNNQAQPLINLHIQNAKMASQTKGQVFNYSKKKIHDQINPLVKNYESAGSQYQKQRSKSKNRQRSQLRNSMVVQQKDHLNKSNMHYRLPTKEIILNIDNKENQSINYNEFSPSRIHGPENQTNFLDSDSSISSPKLISDQVIAQKLEKQYFMDKSTLLKHLSPERQRSNSKQKSSVQNMNAQNMMSDREHKKMVETSNLFFKSNNSTIIQNHNDQNNSSANDTNNKMLKYKIKRPVSGSQGGNNKLFIKGVDKIIKENLRKNRTKEEEEISKRYLEELKQKIKKNELTQRNQQVRKINASKIFYQHQHKNSQLNCKVNLQKVVYKKQRSKSCMNKTDSIFGGLGPRSKERLLKQEIQVKEQQEQKKEKKREKSLVLELKELKRQIDGEIRKEIQAGKLEVQPISAANKRTNLSTINAKREPLQIKQKKENVNVTAFELKRRDHDSRDEILADHTNIHQKPKSKSKSKDAKQSFPKNLKKFMDKKKNIQLQMKSLEQTIEHKKQKKIKENLKNLNKFVKQHFRQQSYNFYPKQHVIVHPNINQAPETNKMNAVKKLKPYFQKHNKDAKQQKQKRYYVENGQDDQHINQLTPDRSAIYHNQNEEESEIYQDYDKIIRSIEKHQRIIDNSFQSQSAHESPQRNKASSKQSKKNLKNKKSDPHMMEQRWKKKQSPKEEDDSQMEEDQMTVIKNDSVLIPNVVPEKGATLIPPQSDIATLDKNHLEKSQLDQSKMGQSIDLKRNQENRKSSDSINKSPQLVELKAKMKVLMRRYGHNLPSNQQKMPSADTKLLIKLHSAAITIQQHFRRHLANIGFYEAASSNSQSQMYIDSDEDQTYNYRFDNTSDKKYTQNVPQQLRATTSPLRVKKNLKQSLQQPEEEKKGNNNFYSGDSSDMEKVIVCSVITSGRAEAEESLNNTQKYVPLRQKVNAPPQLPKAQQPQHQLQPSSITSSAQSGFATAIKAPVISQPSEEYQQPAAKKNFVPSLNFGNLSTQEQQEKQNNIAPKIHVNEHGEGALSSNRSIFERTPFQDFAHKVHNGEGFDMNNYPEMIKIREYAIKYKEKEEKELLKKMVKNQQISPRTYEKRRKDLEIWVVKEQEEVKKTKKVFEEQYRKTAEIIKETQLNQDRMKKLFTDVNSHNLGLSVLHNRTHETLQSENTEHQNLSNRSRKALSHRRQEGSNLLEQINEYQQPEDKKIQEQKRNEELKKREAEELKRREEKRQQELEQKRLQEEQQRLQEEQKRKEEQQRLEAQRQQELLAKQQEAERERQRKLKQEEDDRIKKLKQEEEDRRKREQEKLKQEEEQRKQREAEQKRQEDLKRQQELQKKKEEEERQRKLEEERQRKLKEEQALKEKQRIEEEQRLKKAQEEKERKEKEEKEKQLQREKELEREREEAKRKELEEQKRKEAEKKQAEREAQKKKDEEYKKKMEEIEKKFAPKVKGHQDEPPFQIREEKIETQTKQQQQSKLPEPELQESENNSNDNEEDPFFMNKQFPAQHKNVKEVLPTEEDKDDAILPKDEVKDDDPKLNRTRSSQQLKGFGNNDQEDSESHQQEEKMDLNNLNDVSRDEDMNHNQSDFSQTIKGENFFSNKFDDESPADVSKRLHQNSNDVTQAFTNDISAVQDLSQKIKEEDMKIILQEEETQHRMGRMSHQMRSQIPVEEEEKQIMGMPVSPVSNDGNIRIQTGSQSLESTLSDGAELKNAVYEAIRVTNEEEQALKQTNDFQDQVDKVTDSIFKTLMDEMKLELDLLLLTDPRRLQGPEGAQGHIFSESGRFLIFERRGIKTDLFAIERYVEEVLEEVLSKESLLKILGEKSKFIQVIQQPLARNSREVLNQLQNSEIGSYEHFDVNYPPVLPLELYLKLEKRRKENREQQQAPEGPAQDRNLLAECEHIHNKVLFDCINDSLLQFKPYGKDGAPLPWSRQNRRLRPMEEFTVEEMFEIVKHDVISKLLILQLFRWAIMQAGTLPRREFVFGGVFDDELFAEIREKKLATLLAREMIETEPKWLNYEFEEAQVKIDIGDMILEQLVTETITILRQNQSGL